MLITIITVGCSACLQNLAAFGYHGHRLQQLTSFIIIIHWGSVAITRFTCMKRNIVMGLKLYGDRHRFIPELSHLQGFKVTEIPTEHRSRKFGKSKYGGARFVTGLLDLLSVRYLSFYSSKPLHFFGTISLTSIIFGGLVELYVLINKLSGSSFQIHIAALIIGVLFITMGFIFLSIGLLAEMTTSHKAHSNYSIKITK